MYRLSLRHLTEGLLVLGTALTIYWQPLARQIPLKASDVVFGLALGAWVLLLLQERRGLILDPAGFRLLLPPVTLLGSLLVATLIGYWRYDLTMSRNGIILLARMVVCIALFLATCHLSHTNAGFGKLVSLALLSPIVLLPAMLVPALSAPMWVQGRFEGLTVNPNTADAGFSVALALAAPIVTYELHKKRRLRALAFAIVAVAMLMFIVWTQSRGYLAGAFVSIVLGTVLTATNLEMPKLRVAATAALAFLIIAAASLLLAPRLLLNSYVARISWGTLEPSGSDTQTSGPSARQTPAPAPEPAPPEPGGLARSTWVLTRGQPWFVRNQYGALHNLERLPVGGIRRFLESPHVQAALLYSELLPTNFLGLGVNYEEKFYLYFPWINGKHHGTNSILDIPIYGGVGAVLSVGFLGFLVARKTQDRLRTRIGPNETPPYAIGAAAAFAGLWIAAILLGSPIFDYQFWILTAIALMESR